MCEFYFKCQWYFFFCGLRLEMGGELLGVSGQGDAGWEGMGD